MATRGQDICDRDLDITAVALRVLREAHLLVALLRTQNRERYGEQHVTEQVVAQALPLWREQ